MSKIPFDIKYRPQIESGEYKVETRSGKNVRIICWDKIGVPIVALVGDADDIVTYNRDGTTGQQMQLPSDLFIVTPEEELTEFEQEVSDMVEYCKEHGEHVVFDYAKRHARTLLALAKKELLSHADESNPKIKVMTNLKRTYFSNPDKLPKWLKDDIATKELNAHAKGYTQGYKDAEKFYNGYVAYRNPTMPTTPFDFGCDGIRCTNPQMDCINCPRKTTGGFNTTCGTSTATLHGNTSATDGKEHNPSFTD